MNQTVDILCRARELYASAPSHAPARESTELGTYCVIGALVAAGERHPGPAYESFRDETGGLSTVTWNAEHSTAEVLAAFDRAIAAQRLVVPPLQRTERRDPVHAGQES